MGQDTREAAMRLKREHDAVVLAHYYVPAKTQELADFVGDSFALARIATTCDASTVVMAGVRFMGESVKLLNPGRRVLLPEPRADCPMAHMADPAFVARCRAEEDDIAVVCYVNSTAELKALSDECVTSSNAVAVVRALPQRSVLFIPDENLGRFVAEQVPEKRVILNPGCCPIHRDISPASVTAAKERHPGAVVLAHPECSSAVLAMADVAGSTAEIIGAIEASDATDFVVCTVNGVGHEIARRCEGKGKRVHFPSPAPCCPDMAAITPEKVIACLETGSGEVALPSCAEAARAPLEAMLELAAAGGGNR